MCFIAFLDPKNVENDILLAIFLLLGSHIVISIANGGHLGFSQLG